MQTRYDDITWHWFKGNEVSGRLLQDVCLFRSCVLFDSGLRENFGSHGKNFGDTQYSDFDSYHIVASRHDEILGTIRVTPPHNDTVTAGVLGSVDFKALVNRLGFKLSHVVEVNRLMVDERTRQHNLGRMLIFAAIGLIEKLWDRDEVLIIGSAGNCTKQAQFTLKHTDFEKIPEMDDRFSETFSDDITFLRYGYAPYAKGEVHIRFFQELFAKQRMLPWKQLKVSYQLPKTLENPEEKQLKFNQNHKLNLSVAL